MEGWQVSQIKFYRLFKKQYFDKLNGIGAVSFKKFQFERSHMVSLHTLGQVRLDQGPTVRSYGEFTQGQCIIEFTFYCNSKLQFLTKSKEKDKETVVRKRFRSKLFRITQVLQYGWQGWCVIGFTFYCNSKLQFFANAEESELVFPEEVI